MKIKARVEGNKIIIPNHFNLHSGEVWLEVRILNYDPREHLELWEEHLNEEKKKEEPVNSDIIESVSKELGLKGIKVEDLIDGKV